jgi:hypothetical protein
MSPNKSVLDGSIDEAAGATNSETRKKPKNAVVNATQSISLSRG